MTPEERNALVIILAAAVLAPLLSDRLAKWVRLPGIVLEIALGILIGKSTRIPFAFGGFDDTGGPYTGDVYTRPDAHV